MGLMQTRQMRRSLALTGAVGALVAGAFVATNASQGAQAASAAAPCQITSVSPTRVARGVKDRTFTLKLNTTCPAGSALEWQGQITWPDNITRIETTQYARFITYSTPSPGYYPSETGKVPLWNASPKNDLAGQPATIGVTAFVDTGAVNQHDGEETFSFSAPFTQVRATRIRSIAASGTTATEGDYVTFTAPVQRANWDTGKWNAFNGNVFLDLQFRADGATKWTKVASGGSAYPAGVSASASGDFRLRFKGDALSGASVSPVAHVTVTAK